MAWWGLTHRSPSLDTATRQQQEKRIEDAIKSIREQYEGVLEKKQEEYVEKYRHLQYIEVSACWCGSCVRMVGAGMGGAHLRMGRPWLVFVLVL